MSKPKIERHVGTVIRIGAVPFTVGAGYSGTTDKLDRTVVRAAEMLAETFGRDIRIRFNTDRRSGGAWIKDSLPGDRNSCQVGLGAGLRKQRPKGLTDNEWWFMPNKERAQLPDEMYISTYITEHCLHDPALAREGRGTRTHEPYSSEHHRTLEDGLAFLVEHVNRDAIKD